MNKFKDIHELRNIIARYIREDDGYLSEEDFLAVVKERLAEKLKWIASLSRTSGLQ